MHHDPDEQWEGPWLQVNPGQGDCGEITSPCGVADTREQALHLMTGTCEPCQKHAGTEQDPHCFHHQNGVDVFSK